LYTYNPIYGFKDIVSFTFVEGKLQLSKEPYHEGNHGLPNISSEDFMPLCQGIHERLTNNFKIEHEILVMRVSSFMGAISLVSRTSLFRHYYIQDVQFLRNPQTMKNDIVFISMDAEEL